MRVKIYQINADKDSNNVKFRDYDFTMNHGGVDPSVYKCVFAGDIEAKSLDDIYIALNAPMPRPGTFQGHSLSLSDVIEIVGDVPEVYGKIDFLYAGDDHIAKVGDTVYYTDPEKYRQEIHESLDCGRPIQASIIADQHQKLVEEGFHFCDDIGWKKIEFDPSQCEEMDGLRVLMIYPHKPPIETRVIDDYRKWQLAVSKEGEDALMEVTYPFEDNAVVVGNDSAKLIGMEGNRHINGGIYAGQIFIVGDGGGEDFCDLTDEQIDKYTKMFEQPEDITPEEVQNDCGFTITAW